MVSIGKINLGKKAKRAFFDLTHDVNTTSDFGFCQPTLCREFYKDSKITLKTKEFVRLGAMPCPTFGRIEVKTHTAFVPVKETFLAYDYLQAQKSVTSANRSYIPQRADYITANNILGSILEMAFDTNAWYYENSGSPYIDPTHFIGRFSIWMQWSEFCPQNYEKFSEHNIIDKVDIFNDEVILSDPILLANSFRILGYILYGTEALNDAPPVHSPLFGALKAPNFFPRGDFGQVNTLTGDTEDHFHLLRAMSFITRNDKFKKIFYEQGGFPSGYQPFPTGSIGDDIVHDAMFDCSYLANDYEDWMLPMSFDRPDFHIMTLNTGYTDIWGSSKTQDSFYINFHLSRSGRRLFKVLTGCRISFGTKSKKIDLMRLLSYYKAWFDKYNPGRNLQWLDTNAFGLIHGYYDYGVTINDITTGSGQHTIVPYNVRIRLNGFWYRFLYDLPQCCYVLPIDNMTCATATPLLEIENNSSINNILLSSDNEEINDFSSAGLSSNHIYGFDDEDGLSFAGGLGIQLLNRIYHLVNKNSVIGSKIDEYLRAHNISRGLPHSNVLGDSKFMCNIDDVFATAGTEDTALGQYAGKGIGSGSSDSMHFETECFGYLIQLVCVVPLGGYVQGMRDCPIERYDFYQPEFDSLGMEPMSQSNFLNRRYDYPTFAQTDSVFGFRPRYFGLKIENNLANGGFALQSQQTEFLPYCLDRIFSLKGSFDTVNHEDYVADEELRYIGRYERFGNYDRIFYDTTGLTENFIVHMIQELSMYAPMKAISESYDTFDKDVDDTSINVTKS